MSDQPQKSESRRIGPFPTIAAAADYLSVEALPAAGYLIEEALEIAH